MAGRAVVVIVVVALSAAAAFADDLSRAEHLAWEKKFVESEALYRTIIETAPSRRALLGLARVILWRGGYAEATRRFNDLLASNANDADALEGRANAAYWSGDYRSAARDFRRVLELDPKHEIARTSLGGIAATMRPSQRIAFGAVRDNQPFEVHRGEVAATFFSDPLTRWTVVAGAVHRDAARRGTGTAELVRVEGDTQWRGMGFNGSAGVFDGAFIGHAAARRGNLTLRVDRREEIASATALHAHAFSTTTTLRWSRERPRLIAAAEVSDRRYSDDNSGQAFVTYAVAPIFRRETWTLWGGASAAARDTAETRFRPTAVASSLDSGFFRYTYRGEYDPYWTPDNLLEGRVVLALERELARGRLKVHADAGYAHDRGRAFGPDAGSGPFPPQILTFSFDRNHHPYRFGLSTDLAITTSLRLDIGVERSVTVDYRATSFHAAVVRRR